MYAFMQKIYAVVFDADKILLGAFLLSAFIIAFAFLMAYALESGGFYAGISFVVFGVVIGLLFRRGIIWERCFSYVSLLSVYSGFGSLLLLTALRGKRKRKARKKNKAEEQRRLQYALPDRENAFVRARLNTVLREEKTGETIEVETEKEEGNTTNAAVKLRFAHARKLLSKLKDAPLSIGERLETEELAQVVGLYLQKSSLSGDDVRLVNEAFSRVLKLAAKYSV